MQPKNNFKSTSTAVTPNPIFSTNETTADQNIGSQSTYANGLQHKQQNMKNLFSALKAGDMASAQKAYAESGLPAMAKSNTSPMGRLFQALRSEDLAGAQKAGLDMQLKNNFKSTSTAVTPNPISSTNETTIAQKVAAALASFRAAQQSSVFTHLGVGNQVNKVV
jgi:hypothetical protein